MSSLSFSLLSDDTLALTTLFWIDVGLGLRTIGEKGVSLSSKALLMEEELTPGVKMAEKNVTSSSKVRFSAGCINSFLLECWTLSVSLIKSHSGYPLPLNFSRSLPRMSVKTVGEEVHLIALTISPLRMF